MKMHSKLWPLAICALLFVAGAGPTRADQCDDDPENLLSAANCGFDTDISQWTVAGIGSHNDSQGSPTVGSMEVDADAVVGGFVAVAQSACVEASAGTVVVFGARYRVDTATDTVGCLTYLEGYQDAACTGPASNAVNTPGFHVNDAGWSIDRGSITVWAAVTHIDVAFWCESDEDFEILYDNAFIVPGVIFIDGFESGDVLQWSASVP